MNYTLFDSTDWTDIEAFIREEYPDIEENSNAWWDVFTDVQWVEFENLLTDMKDIDTNDGFICIADVGRWNGRYSGYKEIKGDNVCEALCEINRGDDIVVSVTEGDLTVTISDHDASTYATLREWRHNLSDEAKDKFMDALYYGKATESMIRWYTKPIGKKIAKYYGWKDDKGMTVKETINRVQEATA